MKPAHCIRAAIVALALCGAFLSAALWRIHVDGKASGLLADACGDGGGCDAVISSRWGVFPPLPAEASTGDGAATASPPAGPPAGSPDGDIGPPAPETAPSALTGDFVEESTPEKPAPAPEPPAGFHIPVAALGLFYFSAIAIWFLFIGSTQSWRHILRSLLLAVVVAGSLASASFLVIMGQVIGSWCRLCLASHVCNFLILGGIVLLGRPQGAAPPLRLVAAVLALIGATWTGEWLAFHVEEPEKPAVECQKIAAELESLKQDKETLRTIYFNQEQVDLDIEDGDPMIPDEKKPRMTLVLFSDFECPYCANYDKFIFEEILPRFNGHLRFVYKYFPLTGIHPNAFKAACAAQAAHLEGKFWEAHDYLIAHRTKLRGLSYSKMASALGLDPLAFVESMNSPEVKRRVRKDMRLANRLRLSSTPTVYLNSRKVSRTLRKYKAFWEERAESLRSYAESHNLKW